jgi:hypothetical protein
MTDNPEVEIDGEQYQRQLTTLQGGGWKKTIEKLKLNSFTESNSMETLRLLANSYKHAPSQKPNEKLLEHFRHLGFNPSSSYMPLPESNHFRWDLAASLSLQEGADYCAITEDFLNRVEQFLADVYKQPMVGKVKGGRASLLRMGE